MRRSRSRRHGLETVVKAAAVAALVTGAAVIAVLTAPYFAPPSNPGSGSAQYLAASSSGSPSASSFLELPNRNAAPEEIKNPYIIDSTSTPDAYSGSNEGSGAGEGSLAVSSVSGFRSEAGAVTSGNLESRVSGASGSSTVLSATKFNIAPSLPENREFGISAEQGLLTVSYIMKGPANKQHIADVAIISGRNAQNVQNASLIFYGITSLVTPKGPYSATVVIDGTSKLTAAYTGN